MSSGFSGNQFFLPHISRFIGQTVTIFTTSGGLSGGGFTGVILAVNCDFVRLVVRQGSAPANPLTDNYYNGCDDKRYEHCCYKTGAVVDIPIDRIASFVHNAI
ncbi:hypothetical protein QA584_05295 [Anaerocolumna sp. AGMB13025]|uniref:hypothetical protein n=1 Tax=Anaerocolumna sp. AGMB13025 TaxID=3039116 RepID=UPI00241E539F|nr:hypothetical protein [Anaerocolumna sp. AGMB13025]WFR58488.1 hypothetical protein QA584_05295 [Anaerocolumna sp. AGMB13025]